MSDLRSTEARLRADLIRRLPEVQDPAEHVGIVDLDRGTFEIVRRSAEEFPPPAYTFRIRTIVDGHESQELYPLPVPEPRFFRCEECEQEARIILSQRSVEDPAAPLHPRCADHLAPGSARAIDRGLR